MQGLSPGVAALLATACCGRLGASVTGCVHDSKQDERKVGMGRHVMQGLVLSRRFVSLAALGVLHSMHHQ